MNLMIAKMTSTYEKVQANSQSYRAHQMVSLIAEFKDDRGPPPPCNIVTFALSWLPISGFRARASDQGAKGYLSLMGKAAAMRIQHRERTALRQFHAATVWEREHETGSLVRDVQARTTSVEALARHSARMQAGFQRELSEIKENQVQLQHQLSQLINKSCNQQPGRVIR